MYCCMAGQAILDNDCDDNKEHWPSWWEVLPRNIFSPLFGSDCPVTGRNFVSVLMFGSACWSDQQLVDG